MNQAQDLTSPYYKTVKTSLKSIVTDHYVIERLNLIVLMAHRITIHTLQFLKLYLLYSIETTHEFPVVDHALIINIMKTLAPKQTQRGRPPKLETLQLKMQLQTFYREQYQPLMAPEEPPLSCEHINAVMEYQATNIETVYLNNIKQHFVTCVERYINLFFRKQARLDQIKKSGLLLSEQKMRINQLSKFLRDLKTDVLDLNKPELSSPSEYHPFILQIRSAVLPNKPSYQQNSIYYDLQVHPEHYLRGMFQMIREMEIHDVSIMNLFPLRTSIVPKYIQVDTTTLVHLLLDRQKHGYTKTHCINNGNLVRMGDEIWNLFFRMEKRCFSNKEQARYRFNHMISTDGVGCSIQLIRKDLFGKTYLHQIDHFSTKEKYINEAPLEPLQNKILVAIDPNLSDLLYCVTKAQSQVTKLRYTQNQRRKETKSKKYLKLVEGFKKSSRIEDLTIIQFEAQLSQYNHKTLKFEKFQRYVQQKNWINGKLSLFYQAFLYRKLRLNGYINQQKSEARFLNRFKALFGSPNQVVIGIGDYEQHQHRKFKEPVKGKGFRQMFRKAGYKDVYLVDEHKTSCRCHSCKDVVKDNQIVGGECTSFRKCQNPRPWRKGESIVRHGLLMCQTCKKLWCRDTNASLNILEVMKAVTEGKERPKYLRRGKVSISNTTSVLPINL